MKHILLAVMPIFLTIVFGYFLKKRYFKSEDFWKSTEALVYYVLFPCLLVLKLSHVKFDLGGSMKTISITIAVTFLTSAVVFASKGVFKIKDSLFTSVFQGSTRYNSYIFLGLSQAIFDADSLAITGLFIAYMIVITNFLSVIIMNQYGDGESKGISSVAKKVATNPLILSAALGIILNLVGVTIEGVLFELMHSLEVAASPLSLLAVGAGLKLQFDREKSMAVTLSCAFKLVLMPCFTILALHYFKLKGAEANMAVLYAALPCAGNAYILARQMGGDSDAMATIITATTLVSALTTPLILGWFL